MEKAVSDNGEIAKYVPVEIGNPVFVIETPILARGLWKCTKYGASNPGFVF